MQRSYSTLLSAEAGLPIATLREALSQEGREPSAKHQVLSAAQHIHDSRRPKAAASAEIVQPVFQRSYSALCADEAGVPIELMQEVLATEGRDESVKPRVLSAAQRIWSSRLDTPPLAQEWAVASQTRKSLRQQGGPEVLAELGSSSSALQRTPPRAPADSSTGGTRKEVRDTGIPANTPPKVLSKPMHMQETTSHPPQGEIISVFPLGNMPRIDIARSVILFKPGALRCRAKVKAAEAKDGLVAHPLAAQIMLCIRARFLQQ